MVNWAHIKRSNIQMHDSTAIPMIEEFVSPHTSQNDCPTSQKNLSQNDRPANLPNEKFEAQSQIFSCQTFIINKSFNTATSGGIL